MNSTPAALPFPTSAIVNVKDHGAAGDGATDDTLAIRKALAALPPHDGLLYFPPGHYLSDTLYPSSFMTLAGNGAWGYQPAPGTILSPVKATQPRLIDLNGKTAVRLTGLTLHGRRMGADMCGIYTSRGRGEQNIVVDNCRVEQFSGSGMAMGEAHVWSIRHSLFMENGLDGLDASLAFDGWISDSMFTANGRCGLSLNNSVTLTGNRIEHNRHTGLAVNRHYGQHLQVTGNLFCSEFGPAIELLPGNIRALAITGNTFRNSGRGMKESPERDCHVRFEGAQGIVFTGNVLHVLWCDTPSTGMILKDLADCVIANNTLFKGAARELIRDLGGHRNTVIRDNPGRLKDPDDLDS